MGGFSGEVQNSWGHKCSAWAPGSPQAAGPPQQPPWDGVSPTEGPGTLSLLHMGNSKVLGTEDPPGCGVRWDKAEGGGQSALRGGHLLPLL